MTREEAEGEEKGQFAWNLYGTCMALVWSLYGIRMEFLWNNTLATRPQQANNALSTGLGQAAGAEAGRRGPGERTGVGVMRLRYSNYAK